MSLENYAIIDSTLRRGAVHQRPSSAVQDKIRRAGLDEFGVEYLELTSPAASAGSAEDLQTICRLGLSAPRPPTPAAAKRTPGSPWIRA